MVGILEEFYEDNDPPYSNYGFYSMEEEPELIDCFTNVIGPNRDLFYFIKEHDCFLNLPEVDIDKKNHCILGILRIHKRMVLNC